MPGQAAEQAQWSALLDADGSLQFNEVRASNSISRFSPVDIKQLVVRGGNVAMWLHVRLPENNHERLLRVFGPYLNHLDL